MEKILFPVGLGYVASAVSRSGHVLEIIDMDAHRTSFREVEERLRKTEFDAVAFGCIVTGYKIVKKLAEIVKKVNKDAWVIVGNSVASSIPEKLLKNNEVDIAVIGEGDNTIVDLLDCLDRNIDLQNVQGIFFKKNDRIYSTKPRDIIPNIDSIQHPEWDLFDIKTYVTMSHKYVSDPYPIPENQIKAFAVNTARGCAYNCTFCYHVFKDNKYRYRSPQNIISEIKELQKRYGINYINFWDELTFLSLKQTNEMIDTILNSGLEFFWTGACRGDLFKIRDISLLKKMKASGCIGLGYSLESANQGILKSMNKKLDPKNFVNQKKALDKAGIVSWTSLVIGYPEETEQTLKQTFDLCYENDIYPSAGFLLPQPQTPIYQYALDRGLICDEETYLMDMGDRQDLRINLTEISQQRLEELVASHLAKIRDKLGLDLSNQQLLKSGRYRAKAQ